jgi:peptidyl-prolyl cis-trans isomerase C
MKIPFIAGALAALLMAAPAMAPAQDADTVLARVGETDITLGHLAALRERLVAQDDRFDQMSDGELYEGLLQQLIQQQALADAMGAELSRADALGLENESRAFLAGRLLDREASRPVDEAELAALYDERFGSVEPAREWSAAHILVGTEAEAQEIVGELEGGADFAALAQERSTGPSGPRGGELGWFGPGQMVPEFEQAVAGLEPGGVSAPVQTQFGWHVVRLNETRARAAPALEQVRPQIEEEARNLRLQRLIERLTGEAEIERMEVEVDPALLRNPALLD